MANNIQQYLTSADFQCIGNVAQHCDLQKLCIAAEESRIFDLIPLFCYELVSDVLGKWAILETDEDYEKYNALINGGEYMINGKPAFNMGLKKVWVYYSYARYLLINQFNDTANGTVTKQNDFSIPMPLREVTDFSNKYRAMGREAFNSVLAYLCANKTDWPLFDSCNCLLNCGCSGSCNCGSTKKMTGFKFKTIRK